jgi:hypothetical protein
MEEKSALLAESDAEAEVRTSAREAAVSVLAWAKANHLLSRGAVEDSVEEDVGEIELLPQRFHDSQTVKQTLMRRAINLVGYNEEEKKVIIFTHTKLNKGEREKMPFHVAQGVTIEYHVGGVASVRGGVPAPGINYPYFLKDGAICCGSSIHPVNCLGAGTLGALVKDGSGKFYGLSNNHVTGACNCAPPGLPILCPGPIDANEDSISPFTIGRHTRLLPINEGTPENIDVSKNWDAAVFEIEDAAEVSSMQGEVCDTPSVVSMPTGGMRVEKVGRTTGLTSGTVVAMVATPLPVGYTIREYGVSKTVYFEEVAIVFGDGELPFSRGGDSGSLVMGYAPDGTRQAVGLVFAGNEQKRQSFILPLPPILDQLDVDLVYGHNA